MYGFSCHCIGSYCIVPSKFLGQLYTRFFFVLLFILGLFPFYLSYDFNLLYLLFQLMHIPKRKSEYKECLFSVPSFCIKTIQCFRRLFYADMKVVSCWKFWIIWVALNTKYINDNMTVASIAEKMHILNKCLKCIYITMYTVKDNILGKKVCWRLATNQPKNCRKIGQRCE